MKTIQNDFSARDEQGGQEKQSSQDKGIEDSSLGGSVDLHKKVDYRELLRTPVFIQDNLLGGTQMKNHVLQSEGNEDIILGELVINICPKKSETIVDEEEELSALELYEDMQY